MVCNNPIISKLGLAAQRSLHGHAASCLVPELGPTSAPAWVESARAQLGRASDRPRSGCHEKRCRSRNRLLQRVNRQIDATTLKEDASIVSIDLSALTSDIGAATQDIATIKNDLASPAASGPSATPQTTAAIAAAGKAIGQAVAKANSEIDQVNAEVTQGYSIANGMATGSCAADGPGHPPIPIRHIPSG